jgi:hypothetical protein
MKKSNNWILNNEANAGSNLCNMTSVADPEWFITNQDPNCQFVPNLDPDPT